MFRSALMIALFCASPMAAQEVTLKLHHFLPETSYVPSQILTPWADQIESQSQGRIKIDRFGSMALGGKPSDLIDQATGGVVDVVWTLAGYTPGRFPRTEVMELPFLSADAGATSEALWSIAQDWQDSEYADLHLLGLWVHGPGVIHSAKPVARLEDMRALQLRAPSRAAAGLLEKAGAEPIGMPAPAVIEALSRHVIDGALFPWEVTSTIPVGEYVTHHTEFAGRAPYTAVLMLAMNPASYQKLPDDLRKVIDEASGAAFSKNAGRIQQLGDTAPRDKAIAAGADIITITGAEAERWHDLGAEVIRDWSANAKGFDGGAIVDQARKAIAEAEAQ